MNILGNCIHTCGRIGTDNASASSGAETGCFGFGNTPFASAPTAKQQRETGILLSGPPLQMQYILLDDGRGNQTSSESVGRKPKRKRCEERPRRKVPLKHVIVNVLKICVRNVHVKTLLVYA